MYLDTAALTDYVSAFEGGRRESLERKTSADKHGDAKIGFKGVGAGAGASRGAEESSSYADTPQAQFQRLTELIEQNREEVEWVDIANPEADFVDIGIGALFDVECELYIPSIIKSLSAHGGISDVMKTMEQLAPLMQMFGEGEGADLSGLPNASQRAALQGLSGTLGGRTVIVGEFDSSAWHLAGQLMPEYIASDVEGFARVIGKVSARWGPGQYKPMLALPGLSLLPREKRRALERKKPDSDEAESYLEGPALMMDVLAIYR